MESVIIKRMGIHPWEQLYSSYDGNYITITLLNQEYDELWKTWCKLAPLLIQKWPKIVKWHTNLSPYYSKSQEHIAHKNFFKHSSPGDIFRKNKLTEIYSQITSLGGAPWQIDPATMKTYRTSITLMLEGESNLEHLWLRLSNLADISKIQDFELILSDKNSISLNLRDAETHAIAQLICHSAHLPYLDKVIKKLHLEEIQHKDIYEYIHR